MRDDSYRLAIDCGGGREYVAPPTLNIFELRNSGKLSCARAQNDGPRGFY
jgi:hypothetical protein